MEFTLVSTIFNEASRLRLTIADLEAQTLKPTEIIITDAGSSDGSVAILEEWKHSSEVKITVLIEKGCNVARGRNLAIAAATTDWIVSTDFGCRFHPQWLEGLLSPLHNEGSESSIDVIGGAFTVVESEIDTLAGRSDYILQRGYPVVMDEFFSVSSRSIAYKKEVWEKVGGYPEWLTLAADDTIFWKLIKRHTFSIVFVQEPYVYWGRHKSNKAFAKEAFRYGLGDGESRINYRNFWSNLIETGLRYLFFVSVLICLVVSLFFALHWSCVVGLAVICAFSLFGLRSYLNAWRNWQVVKSDKYNMQAFLNALWQIEISRRQYIKGYLRGLWDNDREKAAGRSKLWMVLNNRF